MVKYFPETVDAPGSKQWTTPDILAIHKADPLLSNDFDEVAEGLVRHSHLAKSNPQDNRIKLTLQYHMRWAMWLRFDLTNGEITTLCRTAGTPDYVAHVRSYYDNVRKQILDRLDWITDQFVKSTAVTDPNNGWCRSTESALAATPSHPIFPNLPSDTQLQDAKLLKTATVRNAWVNIDILTAST